MPFRFPYSRRRECDDADCLRLRSIAAPTRPRELVAVVRAMLAAVDRGMRERLPVPAPTWSALVPWGDVPRDLVTRSLVHSGLAARDEPVAGWLRERDGALYPRLIVDCAACATRFDLSWTPGFGIGAFLVDDDPVEPAEAGSPAGEALAALVAALVVEAPCGSRACDELRDRWSAFGPDRLVERIHELLDLVGHGFSEVTATPRHGLPAPAPWSSLPRHRIDASIMQGGPPAVRDLLDDRGQTLDSRLAIRCDECGRTFTQRWTFERGYEAWIVEDPAAER